MRQKFKLKARSKVSRGWMVGLEQWFLTCREFPLVGNGGVAKWGNGELAH